MADEEERERFKHKVKAKVEAEEKGRAMLAAAEAVRRRDAEAEELRRKTAPKPRPASKPQKASSVPATSDSNIDVWLAILSIVAAVGLVFFVGFSNFFSHLPIVGQPPTNDPNGPL